MPNIFQPAILPREINLPPVGIICSHPERVERFVRELLTEREVLAHYRGYKVYGGLYNEHQVFIAYVGIGAPSASILIEELIAMGAKKIIRVGTNDNPTEESIDQPILIVSETHNTQNLTGRYSESADKSLFGALKDMAEKLNLKASVGNSLHLDFYYQYLRPEIFAESPHEISEQLKLAKQNGISARDMESGCLFYLGRLRKIQTATLLHTILRHSVKKEYTNARDLEVEKLCGILALEVLTERISA